MASAKDRDTNAYTVWPTRTRLLHEEHNLPQLDQSHPSDPKIAVPNPRQTALRSRPDWP